MAIKYYIQLKDRRLIELKSKEIYDAVRAIWVSDEPPRVIDLEGMDEAPAFNFITNVFIDKNAEPDEGTEEYYRKHPEWRPFNRSGYQEAKEDNNGY
jgi:hypothetical protein